MRISSWPLLAAGCLAAAFLDVATYAVFGAPGFQPVRGDFYGDGRADLMTYTEFGGYYFGGPGWSAVQ